MNSRLGRAVATVALCLAVAVALTGCAGSGGYYIKQRLPQDMAQVRKPAPGKSMVVFIRPGSYAYAIGINVFDGTKVVGHCRSNSYFQYECSPGKHIFGGAKENFAFVEADLLPDRIYYVKVAPSMGWWSSRVNMWPLYPGCPGGVWEDLPRWLARVAEVTLAPEMEAWERDNRDDIVQKYNAYYEPWSKMPDRNKLLPDHGLEEPIQPQE